MRFVVTDHCLDRFVERVRPALERERAAVELERLLVGATTASTPPAWYPAAGDATVFVSLTEEIVCPGVVLASGRVRLMSCVTRGALGAEARAARSSRRRRRKPRGVKMPGRHPQPKRGPRTRPQGASG